MGDQLYQIDDMVSDIEDSLCGVSLRSELNRLPEHIYVKDNCYTLNIRIHNDGVNLDYCCDEDELFSLGESFDVDTQTIADCVEKAIKSALGIIKKNNWDNYGN